MRDRGELREIRDPHRPPGGERSESLVLPARVGVTLVRDVQLALADAPRDATVAEERADDHLELHGIRREPPQRGVRTLQHVVSYRRGLERQGERLRRCCGGNALERASIVWA